MRGPYRRSAATQAALETRVAYLLKMMEWPRFAPQENEGVYLQQEGRPNTRYMRIGAGGVNEEDAEEGIVETDHVTFDIHEEHGVTRAVNVRKLPAP